MSTVARTLQMIKQWFTRQKLSPAEPGTVHTVAQTITNQLQTVKLHKPLIRFPNRKEQVAATGAVHVAQTSQQNTARSAPTMAPADFGMETVPARFARRPISLEEMQYIERGGPE